MSERRVRGRPKGSGISEDERDLLEVASIMIERGIKMQTKAMKAYLKESGKTWETKDESLIRRWQVKWKTVGEAYLQAAKDRKSARLRQEQDRRERPQTSIDAFLLRQLDDLRRLPITRLVKFADPANEANRALKAYPGYFKPSPSAALINSEPLIRGLIRQLEDPMHRHLRSEWFNGSK